MPSETFPGIIPEMRLRPELRPGLRWEAHSAPPDHVAGLGEGDGKGKEGRKKEGKEREGREVRIPQTKSLATTLVSIVCAGEVLHYRPYE